MLHRFVPRIAILVALLVPSCGGSSTSTPAAPQTPTTTTTPPPATGVADLTITIIGDRQSMSFSPANATLKVGQTVAWRNTDTDLHTATQDSRGFDTGTVPRGGTSAPLAMTTAGTFPYHCSFHPDMVATLSVTP
jgi:plastocyanin